MNHSMHPSLDNSGGGFLLALRFSLIAILMAGLGFPLFAAVLGGLLFPLQAQGSLVQRDGVVVGSLLVAQPFTSAGYFQPRPSAANYDPRALAGSNWAAGNPALRARMLEASAAIVKREGVAASEIPIDMITASGSGIDPHISPEAAQLQAGRVARTRGMDPMRVQALVHQYTLPPSFGVLGQARVNVLQLNLALDAFAAQANPH